MTFCFDMDGTIADFYGVEGWLDSLMERDPSPYKNAEPLVNFSHLARLIHKAQADGHKFVIISWLSKTSTEDFDKAVTDAKIKWLRTHLPSVWWDEIHIVKYGTPKSLFGEDILFDDEKHNRDEWNGTAYEPSEIFNVLREVVR